MWDFFVFLLEAYFVYRLGKMIATLCRPLALYVIYPKLGLTLDLEPYRKMWVVVTGSTDGIGKAYAEELARRGFSKFLLISRNQEKLDLFSSFLIKEYSATVRTLAFDFTSDDYSPVNHFLKKFDDIGVLVNNVGAAVTRLQKFTDQPAGTAETILKLNSLSVIKMCEFVMPKIVRQNRGIVVTISSIQGWRPIPLQSTYSPSKVCASYFSECLAREYQSKTIRIQCLFPGLVATKMTGYTKADEWHVVSPETFAKQAVDVLGMRSICCGSIVHDIQAALASFFPWWMLKHLVVPYYAMHRRRLERIQAKD